MIYYIWRADALALYRKMIFFENISHGGAESAEKEREWIFLKGGINK